MKAIHPSPIELGVRPKSISFDGVERLSSSTRTRSSGRSAMLKLLSKEPFSMESSLVSVKKLNYKIMS